MLLLPHIAMPAFHDTPIVRVVEQAYRARLLTFGLGFVAAVTVFNANGLSIALPALFALNACAWPALARAFALRSTDPHGVEIRNLLIDSALGGAWIALLQFNLLPCALLTVVLSCDKAVDVLMRCLRERPAVVSYPRRMAALAGVVGAFQRG